MVMNLTKLSSNATTTPSGIFETPQKITKRDVAVFGTLLMKCRSLDVGRRLQTGRKLDKAEVEILRRFCIQAIEDVNRMERGEHQKSKGVVS